MKILIVDDSVIMRNSLKTALLKCSEVVKVETAITGKEAIIRTRETYYDSILIDAELPVMDGVQTVKEIRRFNQDIKVILFANKSLYAAEKVMKALAFGADDFVEKFQFEEDPKNNLRFVKQELLPRLCSLKRGLPQDQKVHIPRDPLDRFDAKLLCIGASTGGPETLRMIINQLDHLKVPMLIVQHMPSVFTQEFARSINTQSRVLVKEAIDGEVLRDGVCYIAPGGFHMSISEKERCGRRYIVLEKSKKVNFVRPSVDVLLKSVAKNFDDNVGVLILSGMGNDGLQGCKSLNKEKSLIGIQSEQSSIAWGMPQSIQESNLHDIVLDKMEIPKFINHVSNREYSYENFVN